MSNDFLEGQSYSRVFLTNEFYMSLDEIVLMSNEFKKGFIFGCIKFIRDKNIDEHNLQLIKCFIEDMDENEDNYPWYPPENIKDSKKKEEN